MIYVVGLTVLTTGLISQVCINNAKKHSMAAQFFLLSFHVLSQQIDISDFSRSQKLPDSQLLLAYLYVLKG